MLSIFSYNIIKLYLHYNIFINSSQIVLIFNFLLHIKGGGWQTISVEVIDEEEVNKQKEDDEKKKEQSDVS